MNIFDDHYDYRSSVFQNEIYEFFHIEKNNTFTQSNRITLATMFEKFDQRGPIVDKKFPHNPSYRCANPRRSDKRQTHSSSKKSC